MPSQVVNNKKCVMSFGSEGKSYTSNFLSDPTQQRARFSLLQTREEGRGEQDFQVNGSSHASFGDLAVG